MTTVTKLGTAALLGIACLVLGTKPCSAEWFGDVYVGASLTDKHDVTVHDRAAGLATYRDVDLAARHPLTEMAQDLVRVVRARYAGAYLMPSFGRFEVVAEVLDAIH